jgi:DUF4097 and DUF4098 domain-containing protein YvlB
MSRSFLTKCAVLLALPAAMAWADDWSKKFPLTGRADLRVDLNDGSVSVKSWDRHEIEARVSTEGWKIGPGEVRVIDRQTGDHVEIDVRVPHRNWEFNIGKQRIHADIWVPRELHADIHTGDGRISAQNLKGELRLSSGDGRIEADTLDGNLEASTGDGRIRVSGRFDQLNLRTGDGSIEADVQRNSKVTSGWRIHTGDGHITLRLPDTLAADLDVRTGDGRVTIDLPAQVQGTIRKSDFRAKLNGGGSSLVVRTNDGAIRVERL